ncbi:hypothetical protein E5K00_02345 [Hymenobacter aquaticus]|uniref:PH domain-containing protein n=1 Tax=Hymenobacter aquaticus TaxID=1867101 RepID=A0A4Z0Q3B0_9BACT|nr:hypothetical protein [Hymenobacter aquaticus]TGE24074.1 hypothetical protein E5K00_02345 [Hymenobacter aquaticus]
MENQFDLLLIDQRKAGWLTLGWLALALGAMLGLFYSLSHASGAMQLVWLSVAVGTLYGLFRLVQAQTRQPARIIVSEEKLSVRNRATGQEMLLPFEAIATCRFVVGKGSLGLQLKLKDGSRLSLGSKDYVPFSAMVRRLRANTERYQQTHSGAAAGQWVDAYWGSRVATVWLGIYALLLAAFACFAIWYYQSADGSGSALFFLVLLIVGFLLYVAGWYATRSQRR